MKKLGLLAMSLMSISLLSSCGKPKLDRWYTYEDWWNYCSNDNPTSEATVDDIGKEVDLMVNGLIHKVRLIDIDHDVDGEGKTIHTTFEFSNVITKADGTEVTTNWNNEQGFFDSTNYDYRESTLNHFLNDEENENSIINMLPKSEDKHKPSLKDVIKPANKKVGINEAKEAKEEYYIATSFDGDEHPYPKLFLLACKEIATKISPSYAGRAASGEGDLYQYYVKSSQAKRLKKKVGSDEEIDYWLRSPQVDDTYFAAFFIEGDGDFNSGLVAHKEAFVAPAFCI